MNTVIIAAGGSGARMGADAPKQFIEVLNKPLIIYTLEIFERNTDTDEIIISCVSGYIEKLWAWADAYGLKKIKRIVPAGNNRQKSVYNGLAAASDKNKSGIITVHDAVRPLVAEKTIRETVLSVQKNGAAGAALPVEDTIVSSKDGAFIRDVQDRSVLYRMQTPQSFAYDILWEAHTKQGRTPDATDDCRLVLDTGRRVAIVPGDKYNIKITTRDDLELFKRMIGG